MDIDRESAATRERYGETLFGQATLCGRRLLEAGAQFVTVDMEQEVSSDGYAKEMTDAQKEATAAMYDEEARAADIVITTALIPGRPAPLLVTEDTVKGMKPGSVIVDMAIEQGGNCPLTERDKVVIKHGVKLIGYSNLPAMVAADASALYARNLLNFINLIVDPKTGEVLGSIPAPANGGDSGLTWAEGALWVGHYRELCATIAASGYPGFVRGR